MTLLLLLGPFPLSLLLNGLLTLLFLKAIDRVNQISQQLVLLFRCKVASLLNFSLEHIKHGSFFLLLLEQLKHLLLVGLPVRFALTFPRHLAIRTLLLLIISIS